MSSQKPIHHTIYSRCSSLAELKIHTCMTMKVYSKMNLHTWLLCTLYLIFLAPILCRWEQFVSTTDGCANSAKFCSIFIKKFSIHFCELIWIWVLIQLFHYEDTCENEILHQILNFYKSVKLTSFLCHHFCGMSL